MPGRGRTARPVGGAGGRYVQAGRVRRVHGHQRHPRDVRLVERRGLQRRGHEDDAVGRAGPQVAHPLPGVTGAPVDRRRRRARPGAVGDLLDTAEDLHGPGVAEVVEDEVDQGRAGGGGGGAPAAAVTAQQVLDPGAGPRGDVGAAVDHAGDGRHGDAGPPGDLRDRDSAPGAGLLRCHVPHLRDETRGTSRVSRKAGARGKASRRGLLPEGRPVTPPTCPTTVGDAPRTRVGAGAREVLRPAPPRLPGGPRFRPVVLRRWSGWRPGGAAGR